VDEDQRVSLSDDPHGDPAIGIAQVQRITFVGQAVRREHRAFGRFERGGRLSGASG
jgi:hypothetical protein